MELVVSSRSGGRAPASRGSVRRSVAGEGDNVGRAPTRPTKTPSFRHLDTLDPRWCKTRAPPLPDEGRLDTRTVDPSSTSTLVPIRNIWDVQRIISRAGAQQCDLGVRRGTR